MAASVKTETHITNLIRIVKVNRRESKALIEYEAEGGGMTQKWVDVGDDVLLHSSCSFSQN